MIVLLYFLFGLSGFFFVFAIYLYFNESKSDSYEINCDIKRLCDEIVRWGLDNIPPFNGRQKLSVKVSNYEHKSGLAVFHAHLKQICIYVKNHESVEAIVNSLLHEVTHYKQYVKNPRSYHTNYAKFMESYGYKDNPMEVEANKLASEYSKECIQYLLENQFIDVKTTQ